MTRAYGAVAPPTHSCDTRAIVIDRFSQKMDDFTLSRLFANYNERIMERSLKSDNGANIRDGIKASPDKVIARKGSSQK